MGAHHRLLVLSGAALLAAAVATGCATKSNTGTSQVQLQNRPRSTATVSVIEPVAGTTLEGARVMVRVSLKGAQVIPQTKTDLRPDEGHIHLFLDGKIVSMTYGLEQQIDVDKGTHLLQAEFVAADHIPFNPRVISAVTFTVK